MRNVQKALGLILLFSAVAGAQDPQRGGGRGRRGGPPVPAGRDSLTATIERAIRKQVQATDDQMAKIRQVNQRMGPRHKALDVEERQVRGDLRQAMMDTANVNQALIGQLVDRMVAFPGRRAALLQEEDKALAEFLSPLQRARFHAIQEQIRRRAEGRGGPPPRKPPV